MIDRADVRAAAWVVLGCIALSLVGAVVWGWLAPAEHLVVVSPERGAPLTNESQHQFDAIAIFVGIAGIVGLVSALLTWLWRAKRGPVLFLGLLVGSVVGAAAMSVAGGGVARLHYPHVDAPKVDQVVALAPSAVTLPFLIAQALVASLVTLVLVSIHARDDLGVGTSDNPADNEQIVKAHPENAEFSS